MWRTLCLAAALASLISVGAVAMADGEDEKLSPYVDKTGGISLPDPETVRARWGYLGTWAVQGADGVEEFHAVYTQPSTITTYRETGRFPEGTVLVKEVRKASSGALTTGKIAWSDEVVLWFVMIKDSEGRFAGNPLWAEGWGWALFLAEDPTTNIATNFQDDCMACHEPTRQTDWVYTQGYPVLGD
jgi:hypothetical protein